MKATWLTICLLISLTVLLLAPFPIVECQNYVQYTVQVNADSSAFWKISYFSDVNSIVDSWQGFADKVLNIVDSAKNATGRDMNVDESSLQINTETSAESKITQYSFIWRNFSIVNNGKITFGDVFRVPDFFGKLYGDAALFQISYPQNYHVASANPTPYSQDNTAKTLQWGRTHDLVNPQTSIVLASTNQIGGGTSWEFPVLAGAVLAVIILFVLGFYFFKIRRPTVKPNLGAPAGLVGFESEEDKVLKLLRSFGGSMKQSDIVEQSKFSKAKASQLLSALEARGIITRYKSGRDKIVNLVERQKK